MPPMSPGVRKLAWRGGLLRLAGSAVILALLFRIVPFEEAWRVLRHLPPLVWLAVLATYLCAHLAGAAKYRLVLNGAGAELNFVQAMRCYFSGLFGTLVLPSVAGGDVLRVGMALRLARGKAGALLGSLVDRMLDVTVLLTLALAGLIVAPRGLSPAGRRILTIVVVAGLLAGIVLIVIIANTPVSRIPYRLRRWLVRLRLAARSIADRPERVLGAYGLGLVVQSSFLALTTVLAGACGLHLPFRAWLFAWPLAKLSALLPVTQGGIGVREAALAALLAPFGAAGGAVVGVGLAWETVIVAAGLIGGAVALATGRLAAGQAPGLETHVERRLSAPPS